MRMRNPVGAAAGLGLAAALVLAAFHAAARADEKADAALKPMQGTWVSDNDGHDSRWVIDGETLKATVNGMEFTCSLKADPKAKPHATLDITVKEGGGDAVGKVAKAIYKFEGERLILCLTMPGADTRPTEFKAEPDQSYLFELKKDK